MGVYQVTGPDLVARLVQRLGLEELTAPSPLLMSGYIQPVIDVASALQTPKFGDVNLDLTGAGAVAGFTVPQGKRWTIIAIVRGPTTGTGGPPLLRESSASNALYLTAGGTAAQVVTTCGAVLTSGMQIGALGTSNGADGSIYLRIHYLEEDDF